jgi:hypothetical protein
MSAAWLRHWCVIAFLSWVKRRNSKGLFCSWVLRPDDIAVGVSDRDMHVIPPVSEDRFRFDMFGDLHRCGLGGEYRNGEHAPAEDE